MSNHITYKHYLLKNGLKDSMEAWTDYNLKTDAIVRNMPPQMQKQQIEGTYRLRFINHAWM